MRAQTCLNKANNRELYVRSGRRLIQEAVVDRQIRCTESNVLMRNAVT